MEFDSYKFFGIDTGINMKSKQVGTKDYEDIMRFKLIDIERRLQLQLDSIEDKNSEEYKRTLKYYEEFEEAAIIDKEKSDNNTTVLKDMPRVIDFIIMSKVSSLVEYKLSIYNKVSDSLGKFVPIYLPPDVEISREIAKLQNDLASYRPDPSTLRDNSEYLNKIEELEFLKKSLEKYLQISTPQKRERLDYEMLRAGVFEDRVVKSWYVFPTTQSIIDLDYYRRQDELVQEIRKNNSEFAKEDNTQQILLDIAIDDILNRSNTLAVNGKRELTRNVPNPCSLIERSERRERNGYIKEPYRWVATISRKPDIIFNGKDSFQNRVLVCNLGDFEWGTMFNKPTREFPQGKSTITDKMSILGISRMDLANNVKNYIVIAPYCTAEKLYLNVRKEETGKIVRQEIDTNRLNIKGNEAFFADVYCSDKLLDLAIRENGRFIGNFEKIAPAPENDIPYSNYKMNYNSPFDIYTVSALKLAFLDLSEALAYRGNLFRDKNPFDVVRVFEEYTEGKLVERFDEGRKGPYLRERTTSLRNIFDKLEIFQDNMQKKIFELIKNSKNRSNSRNPKIPGED